MIKNIYSIKDTIPGEFKDIFFAKNDREAMRMTAFTANYPDKNNPLYNSAKDMQLYQIAKFDTETGVIQSELNFVCNVADLKQQEEK